MSSTMLKIIGIACFAAAAVCLFIAWERYDDRAEELRPINEITGPAGEALLGEPVEVEPEVPAISKYMLFFAILLAFIGIACLIGAKRATPSISDIPTSSEPERFPPEEH